MFSKRSHKENAKLTERFSMSQNVRLIQDLPGVHCLVKSTVNEGFLAVNESSNFPRGGGGLGGYPGQSNLVEMSNTNTYLR